MSLRRESEVRDFIEPGGERVPELDGRRVKGVKRGSAKDTVYTCLLYKYR